MTFAQQLRLVIFASAVIYAVYYPAALILARSYVPIQPPPGTVRQIFALQRSAAVGFGFVERTGNYRRQTDISVYEDNRPLIEVQSIGEVDRLGRGTYAQEDGAGIVLSATNNSDPRTNPF